MGVRKGGDTRASEISKPTGDADIASIGSLLGNPARCQILMALDGGRALPATFLAVEAGLAASTASVHLSKLVGAGLVSVERSGRFHYYQLAGPEVGEMLELLMRMAPARPVRSLREGTRAARLRAARTCYDHLAGRLGVAIMDALVANGFLMSERQVDSPVQLAAAPGADVDYRLSVSGLELFHSLGVCLPSRPFPVRYCIDWSERRHHLGGTVGRQLFRRLVELRWIERDSSSRAVEVTDVGQRGLDGALLVGHLADHSYRR